MLELLSLLLPVAAASGWYAARRHYRWALAAHRQAAVSQTYGQGVSCLVSEKTEEAIHWLMRLADTGVETLDLQLAIGKLFRRNGDLARAIDLHERLGAQPYLTEDQRHAVRFELGMDYLSAGLLDRAEAIFVELVDTASHRTASLRQLLGIYLSEKDWPKATECARSLKNQDTEQRSVILAQLLCEQAESAMAVGAVAKAREFLHQALGEDPRCVRATLLKCQLSLQAQRWDEAGVLLRAVEFQNPAFLPEIIDRLRLCHANLRQMDQYIAYLEYLYQRYRVAAAALRLAEEVAQREGYVAAANYLIGVAGERPKLEIARRALDYIIHVCKEEELTSLLQRTLHFLELAAAQQAPYGCTQCGFECRELHWQCPSCRYWGTIQPAG
ncbi:MAG TPA: lipopolysaccharide assembly protein LapB [Methylococcus sp.]|nr:lipopolysaccharide assembly protein LapB [Methylococcus sp.]